MTQYIGGVKLIGCIAQTATAVRFGNDGIRVQFDFPESEKDNVKALIDLQDTQLEVYVVKKGLITESPQNQK